MMKILSTLNSAVSIAAARTSQEAVVFSSLGSTELPEVYHLEDEDEEDEPTHFLIDDMTEDEYLMKVMDPDYVMRHDVN